MHWPYYRLNSMAAPRAEAHRLSLTLVLEPFPETVPPRAKVNERLYFGLVLAGAFGLALLAAAVL
jgi:hypothetical protein